MTRSRRPSVSLALGMLVLVAACTSPAGGSSDTTAAPSSTTSEAPPTTQPPPPTTAAPTTAAPTTAAPTTSTTTSTTTTTTTATPTTSAPPNPEGSGCAPGPGDLPDGTWYGLMVTTTAADFEFDLACFFTGDDAIRAAAEDGAESPPNDIYVRNQNTTLRTVEAAADTPVIWFPNFGDPASERATTYAEYVTAIGDRGFTPGVWLEIDDGVLTEIREQWTP